MPQSKLWHWKILFLYTNCRELPWWLSGKEPVCQCRGHRFNPWIRKIPWRRKWQPAPIFLPGKSHGQRSLMGYSPWGHKRVRQYWATKQQQHKSCRRNSQEALFLPWLCILKCTLFLQICLTNALLHFNSAISILSLFHWSINLYFLSDVDYWEIRYWNRKK